MQKLLIILSLLLLTACGGRGNRGNTPAPGDTLYTPRYASGFAIYAAEGGSIVEVTDPWQGAENIDFLVFLSRNGAAAPEGFTGETVDVPIKSAVCMSSSYVAFLDALGHSDVVKGISGARYITNPAIRARYASGEVKEVGYDSGLNYELIAAMNPDVMFVYGVGDGNSATVDKLRELGIEVVYVGDYVEQSPLGKAEWLVFMSEFFDARERGVEIFDRIADQYEQAAALVGNAVAAAPASSASPASPASTSTTVASQAPAPASAVPAVATPGAPRRPKVMLNSPWRDSWFVPGDRSYMVRLLTDAGADYACAGVDEARSRPISIETAFIAASGADFWLGPGSATTRAELTAENPKFKDIKCVQNGNVYNNNARRTPEGGSDFWESGTVNPHIVLKDMIKIFHPELLPDHELYYFLRLE